MAKFAHDMRNSITAVRITAQIMCQDQAIQVKAARIGQRLDRVSTQLDDLTQDVLDAERILTGQKLNLEFAPVDARMAVAGAVFNMTGAHGSGFKLVDGTPEICVCDARYLRRAVQQLLDNGFRHGSAEPVTVALTRDEQRLEIKVQNRRCSDLDNLDWIQAFSKPVAEAFGREWGFGLSFARLVSEGHGGRVEFHADRERVSILLSLALNASIAVS